MDDEAALVDAFERRLRSLWSDRYPQLSQESLPPGVLESVGAEVAELAVGHLFWARALGECVSAATVAKGRGDEEPQQVLGAIAAGEMVGIIAKTEALLPVWQFEDFATFAVRREVVEVLGTFRQIIGNRHFTPETVVLWSATQQPELEMRRPRDLIAKGETKDLTWSAEVTARALAL